MVFTIQNTDVQQVRRSFGKQDFTVFCHSGKQQKVNMHDKTILFYESENGSTEWSVFQAHARGTKCFKPDTVGNILSFRAGCCLLVCVVFLLFVKCFTFFRRTW